MGLRYAGGDFSRAMIGHAREVSESPKVIGFAAADAERLPLRDNSVDCVLLWRLLHHIVEPEVRLRMLREAARVTRHQVLVSFHHPLSFTFITKFLKRTFGKLAPGMPEITHWRLRREAEACGLHVRETKGFRKYYQLVCLPEQSSVNAAKLESS
jgi:ubiquinone/menaquinone biosynthesis C-methylase UbiE